MIDSSTLVVWVFHCCACVVMLGATGFGALFLAREAIRMLAKLSVEKECDEIRAEALEIRKQADEARTMYLQWSKESQAMIDKYAALVKRYGAMPA